MKPNGLPTTYNSDSEQLAALRLPFNPFSVKYREQGGKELSFYEGFTIQQRLLDVLGTGLSIKTGQVISTNSHINIETILEIEWASGKKTVTSGWGSSDILTGQNGKIVNDPYKSAATDSIKVAASKLGVGAELYDLKYREEVKERVAAIESAEAEIAFLTCQECQGDIEGGTVLKPDGKPVTLDARAVATTTRQKFGKRLCIECAKKRRASPGASQSPQPS